MTASDGGSAFPVVVTDRDRCDYYNVHSVGGMTKREAFAMAAMQGYCSFPHPFGTSVEQLAEWSCAQADALLAELVKERP